MIVDHLTTDGLRVEIIDSIAILTLTQPHRGNPLPPGSADQFKAIWDEVKTNLAIRAAVVTAEGDRHFCTGADVSALKTGEDGQPGLQNVPLEQAVRVSPYQNRVLKPVIAAVNGLVNGGGHHLVADADIIVASRNAAFMDTHVNVGQVGAIENIGLAKRLPLGTVLRMTLQGKSFRLSAERAFELGLVDELVDGPSDVLPKALEIAHEVAKNSPQAVALSKQAIWSSLETPYSQACEFGWSLIRNQWSHPDFIEGPKAFAEKREPIWTPDPNARR